MNQDFVKNMLKNAVGGENREQIDWIFYDSLTMTASVTQELVFFQQSIGTVGRARTNMKTPGMLPSPQSFVATEIGMVVDYTAACDLYVQETSTGWEKHPLTALFDQLYWDFNLSPSRKYEGTGFQFWKTPTYLFNGAALAPGGTDWTPKNPYKSLLFEVPITIPSKRSFDVTVHCTLPADKLGFVAATNLLYVYLRGYLRRNS